MSDTWWLLACLASSAVFAVIAATTAGRWRLPWLWVSTSFASVGAFVLASKLDDGDSLRLPLVLAAGACGALALAVSVRARPRKSIVPALIVAMIGAVTPLFALYTVLIVACASGSCLE